MILLVLHFISDFELGILVSGMPSIPSDEPLFERQDSMKSLESPRKPSLEHIAQLGDPRGKP